MPHQLALVIHGLRTGGAERVLARLANHWVRQGHAVTLITLDAVAADEVALDAGVRRIGLDAVGESRSCCQAIRNNSVRIRRLRRAIRDSGATQVVSFTDRMNILTLLACRRLPVHVVIAERSDPRHQPLGRVWEFLRRRMYPRCDALVVQTAAVAEHLQPILRRRPVFVIPNGVALPTIPPPAAANASRRLIAAGRLSREKGFDLLIEAFGQIAAKHPDWRLDILGEGPQRDELQRQIERLQLTGKVRLPGRSAEPEREFFTADLFVLPSRYEGFPNALLEAMACGLPAIAFACESGPAEILRDGLDGLLVPVGDVVALSTALDRLMSDAPLRQNLAARAREVAARFSEADFLRRWDDVLGTDRKSF